MSLIRTGLFIACGVALLPSDRVQQQQIFNQAAQAAGWAAKYCTREPVKCEQAADLWSGFKEKALFAGQLALEASQKYAAGPALRESGNSSILASLSDHDLRTAVAALPSRDNLTSEDLRPAWRGPNTK